MTSPSERYRDVQRTRPWWLVLLTLLPTSLIWSGAGWQMFIEGTWGSDPASDAWLTILFIAIGIVLPLLLLNLRLTVVVTDRIAIRFFPFMPRARVILPDEIRQHQATKYDPILDYGGWGIKGTRMDRSYNMMGDEGVKLFLKNGRTVLIGSQRPADLDTAIGFMLGERQDVN